MQSGGSSFFSNLYLVCGGQVIAVNLPIDEISGMREMFMDIDKDKSGNITIDEFAAALHKKGQIVTEKEIEKIMK
eukprot:scaffold80002_cov14-Tisochrysis_lutea.AAC.1